MPIKTCKSDGEYGVDIDIDLSKVLAGLGKAAVALVAAGAAVLLLATALSGVASLFE